MDAEFDTNLRRFQMERYEAFGPTLLRTALGVVFLVHSVYLKVIVFTVPGTVAFFESLGLPGFSAYAVLLVEAIGGSLLILGVGVRQTALALAVVSLGATWAHIGYGWLFTNEGGGWEYPLFLSIACFTQALLGPGALKIEYASTLRRPVWVR